MIIPAGCELAWGPQGGPQTALTECPVEDVGFGGARGGGKSDGLLGDWLGHQHRWGANAKGLMVRRSYPELEELVNRGREIYAKADARFKQHPPTWTFPNKAVLRARYLERDKDAERYQGWNNTYVGVDEAGNFPSPKPLDKLRATLRSTAGVPCVYRQTMNPGGPGHNWNKMRYIDPAAPYRVHTVKIPLPDGSVAQTERVFIPSTIEDNVLLTAADPGYWNRVAASVAGQEWLLKAWRFGIWDIVAGGYFDDIWWPTAHVLKPFPIPPSWRIDRAFDWGSSKPFVVQWWAESNGEPVEANGRLYGNVRGDLFHIREWYGWNGQPNEGLRMTAGDIAEGIVKLEKRWGLENVKKGPADSSIFTRENGPSIADDMAAVGVKWEKADKSPGSRVAGWLQMRKLMLSSRETRPETPGLYVFDSCRHFIRTVPVLQRDDRNQDDIDTDMEDHAADAARYRVTAKKRAFRSRRHRV